MKKMVVWLSSIDSSRSRTQGRKISRGLAIKEPHLSELTEAAETLGLAPEPEPAEYPRDQGKQEKTPGRVLIKKEHSKLKTLKLICDEIRRIRQAKG